jgi:hypothetical protein
VFLIKEVQTISISVAVVNLSKYTRVEPIKHDCASGVAVVLVIAHVLPEPVHGCGVELEPKITCSCLYAIRDFIEKVL